MVGLEPAHKNESQIERIIFFSDAVFAIAIFLSLIDVNIAKSSPIFIFPIIKIGNKKFAGVISRYKKNT